MSRYWFGKPEVAKIAHEVCGRLDRVLAAL